MVGSGTGVTATLQATGGAAASSKWMKLVDADSFAGNVDAADLGTPVAGNYKVTFYYKNGNSADPAMQPALNLKLFVKQGGNNLESFSIPATLQDSWTAAETPIFAATATPIEIFISKNNGAAPVPPFTGEEFSFDQIILVPVATIPLSVSLFPGSSITIGNTHTLKATVAGGSGSFTSVGFDVNNDSTIDFTDNSAPFEFAFDTRTVVATGQGTAVVRAVVTDSASATAQQIVTYPVDNRWGGRESLVTNSDFSAFTGNLPDGWVDHQGRLGTAAATYGPDATSYNPAAGQCLKITFAAGDYTDRYTLRSVGRLGKWVDMQSWYWGKGSSNRMFYGISTDGISYTNLATIAAQVNNASWTFAQGVLANNASYTDTTYICLMTHNFAAGDSFYDDVNSYGTKDISSSVDDWKLF